MFDRQRCSYPGTVHGSTAGQGGEDGKITGNAGIHAVPLSNTRALLALEFRGDGKKWGWELELQRELEKGKVKPLKFL